MTTEPDTSTWKQTPDGIPIPPPSPYDVLYEAVDGIARITLNRPLVLNAINRNVTRLLDAALDKAEADDDVRAVILTGAGRAFSAGGDLWASLYPDNDPAPDSIDVQMRIWSFPKPVIAAVRGHAVGQGCELAGVCDLTIASDNARFGEIQIRHGFGIPVLITPFLTNQKLAKEVVMLGEVITADDAHRMGLVNRVVPDDQLEDAANEMARKLAALPPSVVGLNKRLVNMVYEQMGLIDAVRYRDNEALRELSQAEDAVGIGRQRVREEQGWAAFKRERDRGYEETAD
ncbi:MAG: enoyl-CoA hydratase/isomerase family protein [Chloroflexota bacterium]|nr:enoyl-CoA hydratase/isomerase family protein [Chloroflexota bacterium]MDE2892330.1 enoyl-CoA hydratase/isomerase family protein [Chloroflexota bacterium]